MRSGNRHCSLLSSSIDPLSLLNLPSLAGQVNSALPVLASPLSAQSLSIAGRAEWRLPAQGRILGGCTKVIGPSLQVGLRVEGAVFVFAVGSD